MFATKNMTAVSSVLQLFISALSKSKKEDILLSHMSKTPTLAES